MQDKATRALAEATFRAQYSDPLDDGVSIAWYLDGDRHGYREAIVRNQLRLLGYDVVKVEGDA